VGKDTVAANVVRLPEVSRRFEMQAWLQASTDEGLRRQLVRFFDTHRPEALHGAEKQEERFDRAVAWLARHSGWLLVFGDATRACDALRQVLQAVPADRGHVLITSQEPLHDDSVLGITVERRIEPFTGRPDLCKAVWSKMGIFKCKHGEAMRGETKKK